MFVQYNNRCKIMQNILLIYKNKPPYCKVEFKFLMSCYDINKQECIPVGCIPSAAVAVGGGGGVCPSVYWDMSTRGGVYPSACWDMSVQGGLAQCMLGYAPPCEQND